MAPNLRPPHPPKGGDIGIALISLGFCGDCPRRDTSFPINEWKELHEGARNPAGHRNLDGGRNARGGDPSVRRRGSRGSAKVSLVATSLDSAVFDLDEYLAGDITVQVTSSTAGAIGVDDAQDLAYF